MNVYLVRHGETLFNRQRIFQGQNDSALTEKGIRQAQNVADYFKGQGITHIFSSDLGRAQQTADYIAQKVSQPVITDARLREINMGVLNGVCYDGLTSQQFTWRKVLVGGSEFERIPEGESLDEIASRMHSVLDECLHLPDHSKVIIVSHGIAISSLLSRLLGISFQCERRFRLENCSVSTLSYYRADLLSEGWLVDSLGNTDHLKRAL